MSNTPELDADGNPITPGGEKIILSKTEYDEMTTRLATLAQTSVSTVEELKEMRKLYAELKNSKVEDGEPLTVEAQVQKILAEKEAEAIKSTYQQAVEDFLDSHQEFSKENDPDGSHFAAFQKAVARMNLTGLKTMKDFKSVLGDAFTLMERKAEVVEPEEIIPSSPRGGSTSVKIVPNSNLLPEEAKLVKSYFNGDTAAYLKAREKRPTYYEELLKYVR